MQQQSLGKDRQLGRSEFELSMVAQNHVLDQVSEFHWKLRERAQFIRNHPDRDRNMTNELPFGRIAETALVAQLVNFPDIVQHHARDEKIEVDRWVVRAHEFRQLQERQYVFEQAAAERM